MNDLTTVHHCISSAIDNLKSQSPETLQPFSIRVNKREREIATIICAKHGLTLADFLRECVKGLVKDYTGE